MTEVQITKHAAPAGDLTGAARSGARRGLESLMGVSFHAAGVDPVLADASSWSERCRLVALGSIVLTVVAMHALGATSALLLLLQPLRAGTVLGAIEGTAASLVAGAVWGLVVLNLFRFVVSSTGHGDGRPGLSWGEAAMLLPKAAFASLLALCASVPITVAIVQDDLAGRHTRQQLDAAHEARRAVERAHASELFELYQQQAAHRREHAQLQSLVKAGVRGDDALDNDSAALKTVEAKVSEQRDRIAAQRAAMEAEKAQAEKQVLDAESFWTQAGRALEHGAGVYWSIAIFLIVLHASPVVVRALSAKGPYAHLVEIQDELTCARHGIARDDFVVKDRDGLEHRRDRYLVPQRMATATATQQRIRRNEHAEALRSRANHSLDALRGGVPPAHQ